MTRYVAFPASWEPGHGTPEEAKAVALRKSSYPSSAPVTAYELGPEVKDPDYGPLVKYIKGYGHGTCAVKHYAKCDHINPSGAILECDCGQADALKAAGL